MKRSRSFWVMFFVLGTALVSIGATVFSQPSPTFRTLRNPQTGVTRVLQFEAGVLGMPVRDRLAAAQSASADAVARYASLFGADAGSAFEPTGVPVTSDVVNGGMTSIRYAQTIGGVPVFGAQMSAGVRGDGALLLVSGKVSALDPTGLDLAPSVASAAAGQAAADYVARRYGVAIDSLSFQDAGLWIYDPALFGPGGSLSRAGLVWQSVISSHAGHPLRVVALVDARSGNVRFAFNTIHASVQHGSWHSARSTGVDFGAGLVGPVADSFSRGPRVPGTADLATYDLNNGTTLPGTLVCDETNLACTSGADPDADSAHFHANGVYDYYYDNHDRDSLDDAGMQLVSSVHYSFLYCNAFWNGDQMAYGDGCGTSIVVDDVVSHELTHGVTEFTSNLVYAYDSGAINESFSDVWGEYYDLTNGTAEDIPANRWSIGEELGGIRDMADPTTFSDPDRVGSPLFWTDARDLGGVHINSGINNKAAFLLADGATFNGQTVTGLGMVKPLHIYYLVQTTLATPLSTYNDLAVDLAAACATLVGGAAGITAADCLEVDEAVLATEMALPSPHLPDSADVCAAGETVSDLFFDDFENDTTSAGNWTTSATEGSNAWTVSSNSFPLDGLRSMRADNVASSSDSQARLTTGILLPDDAYLHFDHAYVWEYDGWDGAVVQYSTNGAGGPWNTIPNAMMSGELYPGRMEATSDAAFPNQFAYTGDSFGPGSTRVDLSSLSGQTVMIRFFASSDVFLDASNPDGWWIDNVRIYTCDSVATSHDLLANGDFEDGLNGWTLSNGNGDKVVADPAKAFMGIQAFKFKGGPAEAATLKQTADILANTPAAGDSLVLSAYFNGGNAAVKAKMQLLVKYAGDPLPVKLKVNVGPNAGYTLVAAPEHVVGAGTVESVKVKIKHLSAAGKLFMDYASLILTPATRHQALPAPSAPAGMRGSN